MIEALAYADECLALAEQSDSRKNIVKGCRLRGQVFLAQGKLAEAEKELATALEVAQRVGNPPQLWETRPPWETCERPRGVLEDARQAYRDALAVIEGVAARTQRRIAPRHIPQLGPRAGHPTGGKIPPGIGHPQGPNHARNGVQALAVLDQRRNNLPRREFAELSFGP